MKIVALRKALWCGEIIRVGQIVEIKGNKVPAWGKKVGKETETTPVETPKNAPQDTPQETKTPEQQPLPTTEETTPVEVDEFAGKTDEEILAELDALITKGIEKNIMLDDIENKTPVQQILELREKLKEAK